MPALPRRRLAGVLLPAVLLASTGLLAACGDDSDALVVYVGRDEGLVGPLLEQFTDDTGIEIDARYAGTPEQLALLLEEGDDTPADVFLSQDAGALGALSETGALRELPPEITDAVLPQFTSKDDTWVGVTGRARVIAYNTETLAEADVPTSVTALTEPEWEGRVGFPPSNASFQSFVTGFRAAEGDDAARTWLEGMVDNDLQTFDNNIATLEAIEAGVIDIGLINHYYLFGLRAEVGDENVVTDLVFPEAGDPGALVNVSGAGILSDNPDAEELLTYFVSEAGQDYFVENTFEYPLVEGVRAPDGLPPLSEIDGPIEDLAELEDLEATLELLEEVGLS